MRTIKRTIVGAFIFSSDDHLLLGKSIKGGVFKNAWVIPGGGIEHGETKLQAVCREVSEEVGIDISSHKITQIESITTGKSEKVLRDSGEKVQVEMTFYDFVVNIDLPSSKIIPRCTDDLEDATWHHISTLKDLEMTSAMVEALKDLGYL